MSASQPHPPDQPGVAHPGDVALVRRTLEGNAEALHDFAERMRCVPRMLAARNEEMGRPFDRDQLADLTQDTLCAVWKRLPIYSGQAALETWVFRFCYFEVLRVLREQERFPRLLDEPEAAAHPVVETTSEARDYEHVLRCLDELAPSEAEVVRLKHLEGRTFDEIGALLSLSANTVKTRYYRGIVKLRSRLRAPSPSAGKEARR